MPERGAVELWLMTRTILYKNLKMKMCRQKKKESKLFNETDNQPQ